MWIQMLVEDAPFPGILADQGRHDFARLVMQQLLQVRERCVQTAALWGICHHRDSVNAWHFLLPLCDTQMAADIGSSPGYSVAYSCA